MAKEKQYRFGEVCRQLDVQPYVLRYWETEFPALASDDAGSAQRVYGEDELAIVQRIKELLYSEGFTLVGAKKKLQAELDEGELKLSAVTKEALEEAEEGEPEVKEEKQQAAAEDEQEEAEEEKPRPVKKKKKATARKKAAVKKTKSTDDDGGASPSVDLKELKAILADARKLLKQLQT